MRYIHPIAAHERFIASGTYRQYRERRPTGYVEQWTIHQHPDGAQLIRADKDGRAFDGRSVLVEAWRSPAGMIERFDLTAYGTPQDDIRDFRAVYSLEERMLYVTHSVNRAPRQHSQQALAPDTFLDPGLVVLHGELAGYGAGIQLVSHWNGTRISDAVLTPQAQREVNVNGQSQFATGSRLAWRLASDEHAWQVFDFWYDRFGITLYEESGMDGTVLQLERYAHVEVESR